MRFTKLSLFIAGAVGILMLGVPRAAHAVAAALVQVANTASNPVIAQGIGQQAAQIVQIECAGGGCVAVGPPGVLNGIGSSTYVVPEGQTLVVTAVDILSNAAGSGSACNSSAFVDVFVIVGLNGTSGRKSWLVPAGAGTAHYVYPSGILFSSATAIVGVANVTSACTLTLDMHGYLTAQ